MTRPRNTIFPTALLLLLLLLCLSACEDDSTGGFGQPCNPDRTCTQPLNCSATTNRCVASSAGGENQACLPGGVCNAGLSCNQTTGTCQAQGGSNQPCLPGGVCNAGLTCSQTTNTCQSSGTGGVGQLCNLDNTCNPGLDCNLATRRCESPNPQGGVDQPCLPDSVCNEGLICNPASNVCKNVMCGDMECATFANETCSSCPDDCGRCCGNGTCEDNYAESHSTCPEDCPSNCAGCQGCCQYGECITYANQTDSVCGRPGEDCRSCTMSGAYCDTADGTCKCNANSCKLGCCANVDTGQHEACVNIADQTDDECGKDGVSCFDCGGSLTCDLGVCACTTTSCPQGCCFSEYLLGHEVQSCVAAEFQSPEICGGGGRSCQNCKDEEMLCLKGAGCAI